MNLCTSPVLLALFVSVWPLAAQPKPSPIKLEDPELYFAFFKAHNTLNQNILNSAPATAAQITAQNASLYGISIADFPKLTGEVVKFMADFSAWQAPVRAYLNQQQAVKKLPDAKTLITYQWQRQRLVLNAYFSMHNALTPSSWNGLHAYINGPFLANQHQVKGSAK